ncbi:papain family cysteine protease [Teladorsagia circumcincta]|uniref:Papain family cysteine protease n=1 Tax=Teladorsagia circumcincta TaxID=45464 RepID=A0A2G9UMA5_TELCI|nr:papain family cysteine protease [Teladorsagia circumcincta]
MGRSDEATEWTNNVSPDSVVKDLKQCDHKAEVVRSNDALRAQAVPTEAQAHTGAPLAEYLKENQKLFEVDPEPAVDIYKRMHMHVKYSQEKPTARFAVLEDENDDGSSCWALSSAAAISDRLCIATNGAVQVEISGDDILSCCEDCDNDGNGRYFFNLIEFLDCIVKDSCRPYQIPPCGYNTYEAYYNCHAMYKGTPACVKECQPGYDKNYTTDKYYGIASYMLPNSVTAIQRDIMKYGSVVAIYTVYQDFYHYKGGIYMHTAGNATGAHAVKIVGWGQEYNVPYWIIANSWGYDWGENGFFRMILGINDCGIEERVAGVLIGNGKK